MPAGDWPLLITAADTSYRARPSGILLHPRSLSSNTISDAGAIAFANMIRFNTTLRVINLRANKIRREGYEMLGESLAENSTLSKLLLEFNEISATSDLSC